MKQEFITIVSGLPRSGTSMMMQMLEAGGIPALTDEIRKRDEDNPKGYYEFEPVKKTKDDPSWLPRAKGKVVKVIYRLIYDLPPGFDYRVVFMQRSLEEVIASQKKMLARSGSEGGGVGDEKMAALFKAELDRFFGWIKSKPHFALLEVDYKEMIADPLPACRRINDLLGGILDVENAASAVDSSLYRNRATR